LTPPAKSFKIFTNLDREVYKERIVQLVGIPLLVKNKKYICTAIVSGVAARMPLFQRVTHASSLVQLCAHCFAWNFPNLTDPLRKLPDICTAFGDPDDLSLTLCSC